MSDMRADNSGEHEERSVTLSAADAAAVDRLLEEGSDAALEELIAVEMRKSADAGRMERVGGWVQTIGSHQAAAVPAGLVERTLAAVEQERGSTEPEAAVPVVRSAFFSRRFAEYGAMAIAASVLIAVLIPGISQARFNAKRYACAQNLGAMGRAFEQYAAVAGGELPSLAMPADHDFRPRELAAATETNHSNTANLIPLVRGNFAKVQALACPGRVLGNVAAVAWNAGMSEIPEELRGYSYASLMGAFRPRWDHVGANIVLADRNPLFSAADGKDALGNSTNHGRDGNYILRANGAVDWEHSPNVGPNRDNIWTVAYKLDPATQVYDGTEAPRVAGDVFLAP